jgi:MATE family multidrug resistance protein
VAESLVGEAVGRRRVDELDTAVRRSTEVAAVTAVVLALLILVLGPLLLRLLTDIASVRDVAARLLPWVSGYVLVSFAAFQLDGIFIGATRTRAMRNASLASLVAFLAAVWALAGRYDNPGLWTAFICYVVTRALTLGAAYPGLRRSVSAPTELRSASVA